jgi:hypothetical protein
MGGPGSRDQWEMGWYNGDRMMGYQWDIMGIAWEYDIMI